VDTRVAGEQDLALRHAGERIAAGVTHAEVNAGRRLLGWFNAWRQPPECHRRYGEWRPLRQQGAHSQDPPPRRLSLDADQVSG
jgi:hypothetical protein